MVGASTQTTIALDDGARTILEQWGNSGPVMLCVHGMTSSRKAWTRFAERFSSRYRVCAYDQRGHGDSTSVTGPMTLEQGVRDLESVYAAIGGAAVLVGHSWGGAVVIRGGLQLPVRAVVAIDPAIVQVDKDWYDEFVSELDELFTETGHTRDARTRQEYADWHPLDIDGKVHAMHSMTSEPIARLYSENVGGTWDVRKEIEDYDRPLLLAMAGRGASIVPPDVMAEVQRRHSPAVKIVTFEDQGHNLYRTDFDAVANELEAFLRSYAI
jgi:pimeloyl-ACP methyl ester carboxylesterase